MIIFGTTGLTSTKGRGQFHCPQCRKPTGYRLRRVRRFFTLYFIPVIPLNKVGEYVECEGCRGKFQDGVLSHDPAKEAAAFAAVVFMVMRRVMALMLLADGEVNEGEIQTIQEIFAELTGASLSREDVMKDVEAARSEGHSVGEYLQVVASHLKDAGKEMVLKAAYRIAAADGSFDEAEERLLAEIAAALNLSDAHFRGVMAELAG